MKWCFCSLVSTDLIYGERTTMLSPQNRFWMLQPLIFDQSL